MRVARRITGEIGVFQWLSSIAEKGEGGARLHVGPTAQTVGNRTVSAALREWLS